MFISVDGWESSWLLKLLREICKVLPLSVFVIAFFWFLISTDYVYRLTGRILYRATCFFFSFFPRSFAPARLRFIFEEQVAALATFEVICQVLFVFATCIVECTGVR